MLAHVVTGRDPRRPGSRAKTARDYVWSTSRDLLPTAHIPDRRGLFSPAAQERQRQAGRRQPLRSLSHFIVASLNVVCHASAVFSRQLFDGPFFLAELSKTCSYVVMLSGALLDQARLFEQVRSMAVTDPLTGLSNYRRLISVLEAELDRSAHAAPI